MIVPLLATLFTPPRQLQIETDKARYEAGESVHIRISGPRLRGARLRLSFLHLEKRADADKIIPWNGNLTFDWQPPAAGGHGFLIVARTFTGPHALATASCGVDVSAHWTDFPRYGYLAHFGPELASKAPAILANLNRFHIDGIQFYDWQWKHHHPLAPTESWVDIAKRPTSADTVRAFIDEAHRRNIACMAYNLGFGAVDGYDTDGISPAWTLYRDAKGKTPYALNMPPGWETSKLYLLNPGNLNWQAAIFPRESEAIAHFGFDGWHMDQLGDLGKVYGADGSVVSLKAGFPSLLSGAKSHVPGDLIFNNVGGYGLTETLSSPVDAGYLEAWDWMGQKTYLELKTTVEKMRSTGKSCILAAYMDYDLAKAHSKGEPGRFSTPGVLLADATILALGGFHLELGDGCKMLCNEYFPNHNLEPSSNLLDRLKSYYDFAVAYEDLLSSREVHPLGTQISVSNRKVWAFARRIRDRIIVHLVNVAKPASMAWRDPEGNRPVPPPLRDLTVSIPGRWRRAYIATPDDGVGLAHEVRIVNGVVHVPKLDYWTMIVLQ